MNEFLFSIFYLQFIMGESSNYSYDSSVKEKTQKQPFAKQVFLKISQNAQENTYVRVSLLINVFKKRFRHKCFPVNFVKFFKTACFVEHLWCF